MLDDFWGPEEYARFDESMKLIFPDRPVVDIDNKDPIFHAVYDLDDRYPDSGQVGAGRSRRLRRNVAARGGNAWRTGWASTTITSG